MAEDEFRKIHPGGDGGQELGHFHYQAETTTTFQVTHDARGREVKHKADERTVESYTVQMLYGIPRKRFMIAARLGLQAHNIRAHEVRGRYFVDFHAEVPSELTLAQTHERINRLEAALRRELRKPDPRDLAMAEIEKTAFLGVHRAEACEKRSRTNEARKEYQQVVRLFPNTSWAKVARARLNKESSEKGEE